MRHVLLLVSLLAPAVAAQAQIQGRPTGWWTDHQGRNHYGNPTPVRETRFAPSRTTTPARRETRPAADPTWTRYRALYRAGDAAYRAGRYAEAERQFRQALALRRTANNYSNLASAILLQGRLAEAEQLYGRALQLEGSHANARYGMGYLHNARGRQAHGAGRYREALGHFERAVGYHAGGAFGSNYQGLKQWVEAQERKFVELARRDLYRPPAGAASRAQQAREFLAAANREPVEIVLGKWRSGVRLLPAVTSLPGLPGRGWLASSAADRSRRRAEVERAASYGTDRFGNLSRHFGSIISKDLQQAAADHVDAALSRAAIRIRVGAVYKFRMELKSYVDPALDSLFDAEHGALRLLPSILAYGPRTEREQAFAERPDSLERAMWRKTGGVRGTEDR